MNSLRAAINILSNREFCRVCGAQKQWRLDSLAFDRYTGRPTRWEYLVCPTDRGHEAILPYREVAR